MTSRIMVIHSQRLSSRTWMHWGWLFIVVRSSGLRIELTASGGLAIGCVIAWWLLKVAGRVP